jgi:outer membrane biosynthesis protein TonB
MEEPPTVAHEEKPQYTSEAMRRRAEGKVEVEAIVLADGTVAEASIELTFCLRRC